MSIYIEYVILDNFVINYLILLCVKKTMRLKTKWYLIALSSLLGTIVAVVLPLLRLNNFIAIPIKVALGLIMVLILTRFVRVKDYIFSFLLFLGYTFLLAGGCMATLLVLGCDLESLAAGGYDTIMPIGLIMLIVALWVSIVVMVATHISRRRNIAPFLRKTVLCLEEHRLEISAFIDSGNKLMDSKSGMPVIILSYFELLKHFDKGVVESLAIGQGGKLFKGVHKIPYNTISGEAKDMVVFEADKLVIFDGDKEYTTNRFIVGITYKKFKDAADYQMLLNPAIF